MQEQLYKTALLHGCFSRFLNYINSTKSRNASHVDLFKSKKSDTSSNVQNTSVNAPLYFHVCQHSVANSKTQPDFTCSKLTTEIPEICSKLKIKTQEQHQRRCDVFTVNFGQISLILAFPLLNLNKCQLGKCMRELKKGETIPK